MKLLEKILVATDFTKASDHVMAQAIELAKVFDSALSLVHVLPDDIENEKVKSLLHETAIEKLEAAGKTLKAQGAETADPILAYGSPSGEIARAANQTRVNLVLIGAGAKRADHQTQLGTTAKRIIQQCNQPVLVVNEDSPLRPKRILCPVDFSPTSRRALRTAMTGARRFGAELIVLNVVEMPGTSLLAAGVNLNSEKEIRRAQQQKKFATFVEDFTFGDLNWRQVVRVGDPSSVILEEIAKQAIDLLVMGTTGKTGFSRWVMGSVAEKVGREVPCSFVMLKSADVFRLRMESRLKDLESHFQAGKQLAADGFFEESIEEFKKCLTINSMHVPAYYAIADVYEEMGNPNQANTYREQGKNILDRIWDQKIEEEVRKHYSR